MPESIETRLARVDQRLNDFIERTDKHLEAVEDKVDSVNKTLIGFAFTIAASALAVVFGLLVATGKI